MKLLQSAHACYLSAMHRFALAALCVLSTAPGTRAASIGDILCEDSARLAEQIRVAYGARKHGVGMRGPDALMEVWVSAANDDWLLVQVHANGTSCIVALGENWQDVASASGPRPQAQVPAGGVTDSLDR